MTREGGELSIDIGGPYAVGIPAVDRYVAKHRHPRYMLARAFIPFRERDAKARCTTGNDNEAKRADFVLC